MQTPEGKVKQKVKALLRQYGAYYDMPVSNGMGKPTLDLIVCCNGYYLAIETKAPGKVPTPRQAATIREMQKANASTLVISGPVGLKTLDLWLAAATAAPTARIDPVVR